MRINRLFTAFLALVMMLTILPMAGTSAAADSGEWTPPLSIKDERTAAEKKANKLTNSNFDTETSLANWETSGQNLHWYSDANGGYLKAHGIILNYLGYNYRPVFEIPAATYKFTGYFRTANQGEIGCLRVQFKQYNVTDSSKTETAKTVRVYIENEWTYVECYVTLTAPLSTILVNGGGHMYYIQDYCMDQFTMTKVDTIPDDAQTVFGTPNTDEEARDSMGENFNIKPYDPELEAQYEVKGLIINHDDCFQMQNVRHGTTYEDIARFPKQFEGTHVTDYFINVNSNTSVFPSDVWTDHLERYYDLLEAGTLEQTNDELYRALTGAYYFQEVLDTDYVGLLHEGFREVGINPWLSFRMNDVHDMSSSMNGTYDDPSGKNPLLSDFFYDKPQFHRVKHHNYSYSTYFNYSPDYYYPEVREHYLKFINEALDRYDTYGIELDYMRECRLFGIGREYIGLDILSQFMRDVYDLVAIYEEKYGHDIRIAARVPSDPMTCYDFGLDPMTWIAERTIDMIIPCSRYENNDGEIPVKLWCSMAHPYGVEVAMGIEYNANMTNPKGPSSAHTIETFAGLCSKAYSQGADKVYFFNFFINNITKNMLDIPDEERLTSDHPILPIHDGWAGYWNAITSLGSPEKLLTFNRRYLISYNDTLQVWWGNNYNNQVPRTVTGGGKTEVFRITVGDVAENSKVFVKFSTSDATIADFNEVAAPPRVWVNSVACEFVKIDYPEYGWTQDMVLTYEIPKEAHDNGHMVIEVSATDQRYPFVIEYMEIFVQAH